MSGGRFSHNHTNHGNRYANQEAINIHLNTSYYNYLINTEAAEGTKCADNQVLIPLEEVFALVRHPH